ncbi:MAG TPA: LuxR family transcriptional regulator [Candidatus Omnitrophota bacterium]|nr:LuxR family transcriptional regulator [Candidatus Omnitrophota bacterium]
MFGDRDILASFVEELRKFEGVEDLKRVLGEAVERLGIASFAYQVVRAGGIPGRLPYFITTYPAAWVERYTSQNYLQDDPLIDDLPDRRLPFLWSDVQKSKELTTRQKQMFVEAREYGLLNGLAVPIHGKNGEFATVSFVPGGNESEANATIAIYRHLLHLLALYYHDHAARILLDKAMSSPRQKSLLSPREKEVLQWTARGKSNWEISTVLGISEKSVEFHLDSARRKLQVYNRTHAVVKAIMLGMIRID